jgi:hypothetical protein
MFTVEAKSLADVEDAVGSWIVSPGTTLTSITGMIMSDAAPIDITGGGAVSSGDKVQNPIPPEDGIVEAAPEVESK